MWIPLNASECDCKRRVRARISRAPQRRSLADGYVINGSIQRSGNSDNASSTGQNYCAHQEIVQRCVIGSILFFWSSCIESAECFNFGPTSRSSCWLDLCCFAKVPSIEHKPFKARRDTYKDRMRRAQSRNGDVDRCATKPFENACRHWRLTGLSRIVHESGV